MSAGPGGRGVRGSGTGGSAALAPPSPAAPPAGTITSPRPCTYGCSAPPASVPNGFADLGHTIGRAESVTNCSAQSCSNSSSLDTSGRHAARGRSTDEGPGASGRAPPPAEVHHMQRPGYNH